MKDLRWGIIGCGDVTEVKSGPAFNKVENSSLVAVMRRDANKARDYANRHHVPRWYDDADKLLNDPEVNAVYVATPPDTHAEYAIRAMEAGKPVYVEKPMARNFKECGRMVECSERTGMPLFVAYYRRCLPGFRKVKELIERQEIGNVQTINLELFKAPGVNERRGEPGWRVDPAISGGGHFFDLGSHQLDFLDYLFGPVISTSSLVKNIAGLYMAEDYVEASFYFDKGIVCKGKWDFSGTLSEDRDSIEIVGEKGKIIFSTFDFEPVHMENDRGIFDFAYPKPPHVQYGLIKEVVFELLGHGKSPSTGESGARTSWVLDHVVRSYY